MSYHEWKGSFLDRFPNSTKTPTGIKTFCPAHDDTQASLSITPDDANQKILLHCHAGCSVNQIVAAMGLEIRDLFYSKNGNSRKSQKEIVATYDYIDESGKFLFQVVRYNPKDFRQRRRDGNTWKWNMQGVRRVLYNLPAIMQSQEILLVAGEKDVTTAKQLQFIATTAPMGEGKGKWRQEYSEILQGKDVIIIGDYDETGKQDVIQKIQSLTPFVKSLKAIYKMPGVKPHGDLTDWVNLDRKANNHEALQEIIKNTPYVKTPEKPLPSWCFWEPSYFREELHYKINVIQYLNFLSSTLSYRIFLKRNIPVVVAETASGFSYCIQRGTQILTVKNEVIAFLSEEGFPEIANELLLKTRLFSLDVLENLPEIEKEKVRMSIFSQGKTRVKLQDDYIDKEPILYYQENPTTSKIYLLNRHDVGVLVSRQGMGKSTALELLISEALFPCSKFCPFHFQLEPDEILLHFDTERTHDDNLRMLRRISKRTHVMTNGLLNEEQEFSHLILEMCADDVDDVGYWMLEKIESIQEKIGIIIIDTLLDTVSDMNSQELAVRFYNDLRHAAKVRNCAMLCTIHASPDSHEDDGKGMGHIGSLFMRKASTFLQVRNAVDDVSIKIISSDFKNAKVRNSPGYGIFAAFSWEENMANFIDYTPPQATKTTQKRHEIQKAYHDILSAGPLTKEKLLSIYRSQMDVTLKTARNHFKIMQAAGLLQQIKGKISLKP